MHEDRLSALAGVRVVVTRAERQAGSLADAFAGAGAAVELLPLLAVTPPADPGPLASAAAELRLYDWVVFTSANGVQALLSHAPGTNHAAPAVLDAPSALASPAAASAAPAAGGRLPPRLRVAAVGAATAAALRGRGVEPPVTAAGGDQSAAGLLAGLLSHLDCGQRVLLPLAADALPTLRDGLLAAGIAAVAVTAYEKRLPPEAPRRAAELFSDTPIGWVTFTSPSVVRHFAGLFGGDWLRRRGELRAASIGAVTSAELRRHGVEPAGEAAEPTAEKMVAAVIAANEVTARRARC